MICMGNEARGDDGIAHRVADLLEPRLPAGVRLLRVRQLDVVHAEQVAQADRVVLVDAERREEPPVRVTAVAPGPPPHGAHALAPASLVGLAGALYGRAPHAVLVSVAAPLMGHSDELSPVATATAARAAAVVLGELSRPAS